MCGRMQEDETICQDCSGWQHRYPTQKIRFKNRSVFQYNEWMKEVMNRFKFRGDAVLVNIFREAFEEARKRYYPESHYVAMPIPLSNERLYERGFNQALLLAKLLDLSIIEPLQKLPSDKQSKKSRNERIFSTNMFTLSTPNLIQHQHILIIDDIYTTGATVYQAASLLHEAGARSVQSLTLIRG